jgi:hypothetical protein
MQPRLSIRTGLLAAVTVALLLIVVVGAPPVPVALGATATCAYLAWRSFRSGSGGS